MVVGRPGEGNGSGLSCASYHAGSIHSSATQLKAAAAVGRRTRSTDGDSGAVGDTSAAGCGGVSGLGMLPVVKS